MSNKFTSLEELENQGVLFKDGDWVESKDQNIDGEVRLIQLADIGTAEFRDRSAKFLTSRKADELKCTFLKKDDILVARMPDPIGRACLFPLEEENKYVTVVDVAIIRVDSKRICPKYLMYYINSPMIHREIFALQSGTTRKRISRKKLGSIPLQIPSLIVQKAVVAKIEVLLNKIGDSRHLLSILHKQVEVYKQSILNSAIRGKLVPQDPNDEPASELIKRIKAEKEALVKAKKIRKVKPLPPIEPDEVPFDLPDGWEWARLGEIAIVGTGATPLKSQNSFYANGRIPWVTSSCTNELLVTSASTYITEKALDETNCKVFPKGTLLIAMYGEGKTRGQVTELGIDAATNQAIAAVVFLEESRYLKGFLKLHFQQVYTSLRRLAAGGVQPNLNLSKIKNQVIPIPPNAAAEKVVKKFDEISPLWELAINEVNNRLQDSLLLRQSILKNAFSGGLN